MNPPQCAACERAVYGGAVDEYDPCKAAYRLFNEITEIVGVRETREEKVEALDDFVTYPVTREMISYIAGKASEVIPCADDQASVTRSSPIPALDLFITSVVESSHCQVPTLMTSLVFLARLKDRLPHIAQGLPCTRHRLFLAALILAAKYVNDSSPKNKHWAIYSHIREFPDFGFSLTEVNLMEKQLLFLLDWDLVITQSDLLTHFEPFLSQVRWDRASIRLEKELLRRELTIDEEAQLPAPLPEFLAAAPPKGTKPPTLRERKRAHAVGILYPDEERHQFLVSKCDVQPKDPSAAPWKFTPQDPEPLILAHDEDDEELEAAYRQILAQRRQAQKENPSVPYLYQLPSRDVTVAQEEVEEEEEAEEENPALFTFQNSFDNYEESWHPHPSISHVQAAMEMSRSNTQDSYPSTRFNSESRDITPASSMTSLSSQDFDEQEFLNDLNNSKPDFTNPINYPYANVGPKPGVRNHRNSFRRQSQSPLNQRVSPTQGHTGVSKKSKDVESKTIARLRQTLQAHGVAGESEDGGERVTKRSRFLPKFLAGGGN